MFVNGIKIPNVGKNVSRIFVKINVDKNLYEFFVPKKSVDKTLVWCKENIPEDVNYCVGALSDIKLNLKKYYFKIDIYEKATVRQISSSIQFI